MTGLAPNCEWDASVRDVGAMLRAVIRGLRAMDDPQEAGSVFGFGPR
ncbi:MAG: hypothetical protein J2P48_02945 [Alphaproteobacteria bacterium]|nr:hypothetical protein [Alphaproteobacteria bacterium]